MYGYWANVFAMLGVAMIATAFFSKSDLMLGTALGIYFVILGSKFHELFLGQRK